MLTKPTPRVEELKQRVAAFMEEQVSPAEEVYERQLNELPSRWHVPPLMEELKAKAKALGLWNLFLPKREFPDGLSNLEYAPLCEIMGRSPIGPEAFNCSAPDTGNMETIARYGTEAQKARWLEPLMEGEIRSEIRRDGDDYVVNGRKWWTSGAMDPRCKVAIFMGLTNPEGPPHKRQS